MFLNEDAFESGEGNDGREERPPARPAPPAAVGTQFGRRARVGAGAARPPSATSLSRPGTSSRPNSSHSNSGYSSGSRDAHDFGRVFDSSGRDGGGLGASNQPRSGGTGMGSGFGTASRPATTSRHESNTGSSLGGHSGDGNFHGGSSLSVNTSSTAAQRAVKARELAAQKRRERQMGSGVVPNDASAVRFAGRGNGGGGGNPFGAPQAPVDNYPTAPQRPMAPGGFTRPKPPSNPRPTSRVGVHQGGVSGGGYGGPASGARANPLFQTPHRHTPLAAAPGSYHSPPRHSGSGTGAFMDFPGQMDTSPTASGSFDRVTPFDDGIETLSLDHVGSPKGNGYTADGYTNPALGRIPNAGYDGGYDNGNMHNPRNDPRFSNSSVQDGPRGDREHIQNASLVGDGSPNSNRKSSRSRPTPARVNVADRKAFLSQPAPVSGNPVQCHIIRRKGKGGVLGFGGKRFPEYFLYLDGPNATAGNPTDEALFLLSARRRKKSTSSNYVISCDEDDLNRNSGAFFGKLRSNFMGTEFTIFDKGAKPGRVEIDPNRSSDSSEAQYSSNNATAPGQLPPRTELGAVRYEYNVLGTKGPRVMSGAIPKVDPVSLRRAIFRPTDGVGSGGILEALKKKPNPDLRDVVVLRSKQPRWNDQMQAYCLNFNGRVTLASVKNFQLCDGDDPDEEKTLLQFGKVGKDAFTMDYFYPMSAIQAFAICLSSFDSKLACE